MDMTIILTKNNLISGLPSRIRVDQGVENADICVLMETVRGQNRGSAMRGRSIHNTRLVFFFKIKIYGKIFLCSFKFYV